MNISESNLRESSTNSVSALSELISSGLESKANQSSTIAGIVEQIFDENDPQMERDIIRIILQYLLSHGYSTSAMVLQEESEMVTRDSTNRIPIIQTIKSKIISGDWEGTETIIKEQCHDKQIRFLLYLLYKQIFLEYVSRSEHQKALHYLFKYIKPLEDVCEDHYPGEFKELCYLLSVKSIQSSSYFQYWPGVQCSREILADTISRTFLDENVVLEKPIPSNRLVYLLKQASCFQAFTSIASKMDSSSPNYPISLSSLLSQGIHQHVHSLLEDYNDRLLPSVLLSKSIHVDGPIRSIVPIATDTYAIATKSDIYSWNTQDNMPTLVGSHNGTIWDMKLNANQSSLVSSSSNGMIKIWPLFHKNNTVCIDATQPVQLLSIHNDIYSITTHPVIPNIIMSGGFDGSIQIWNYQQLNVVKEFQAHKLSVTALTCNSAGNLLFSGGKDAKIEIWDLLNFCHVASLDKNLKEITGLEYSPSGNTLAIANRSNCHYLMDTRTNSIEMTFHGVMNTRSNFLRVHFMGDNILYSGSENGVVCLWDIRMQKIYSKLRPASGCGSILDCRYRDDSGLLAAGCEKGDMYLWSS